MRLIENVLRKTIIVDTKLQLCSGYSSQLSFMFSCIFPLYNKMLLVSPFAALKTHTTEEINETHISRLATLLFPMFTKTWIFLRLEQCRLLSAPAAGRAGTSACLVCRPAGGRWPLSQRWCRPSPISLNHPRPSVGKIQNSLFKIFLTIRLCPQLLFILNDA